MPGQIACSLPVISGGKVRVGFEFPDKMRLIVITSPMTNFGKRLLCVVQQV